jgi:hypothetical protein
LPHLGASAGFTTSSQYKTFTTTPVIQQLLQVSIDPNAPLPLRARTPIEQRVLFVLQLPLLEPTYTDIMEARPRERTQAACSRPTAVGACRWRS